MSELAALYARVSTREQKDHGTSLDTQVEAMQAWAAQRGLDTPYVLTEDWTGTQLGRPRLDEAKELARKGKIDALLVYSWDRLARDATHQHVLRYLFEEQWGISVICITEPEMDGLASMVYQTSIGMAAEIENFMRRERTTRGIRRAALEKGQLPSGGHGLYGYNYLPKSKGGDGKRTINREETRVVRLIFGWFVEERLTLYRVAKRLAEMGIPTKRGKEKWALSTLHGILTNPAYCGRSYAYRWETVEPEKPLKPNRRRKRSSVRLRPEEEWVELKDSPTPAIISEELWQAAQKRLKQNPKLAGKPKHAYLLRGMVECFCAKSMVGCSISDRYRYYRCCGKQGVEIDHHFQVPAGPLEEKVWADVQAILTYPEIIQEQLEAEAQNTDTILQERIAEAEEAIASLELAERRVISLYSLGKLDERKIDDEVDRIRTEREGWRKELAKLQQRLEAKLELVAQKQRLEEICQTIDVGFDDLSFEQKREILQALGLRVRVKQDRSYECFAALPAICESSATSRSWGRLPNPIPLEFEGVI